MTPVVFTAAAEADVVDAVDWYEAHAPGLGAALLDEIRAAADRISERPGQFPKVHKTLRRALLRRFPYALFFRSDRRLVQVVACFHMGRSPKVWKGRS